MWSDLDSKIKALVGVAAAVAVLWGLFGFLDTGNQALAESRRAQRKVQRLEDRYNQHIDSAFKAWRMQRPTTTTTVEGVGNGMH